MNSSSGVLVVVVHLFLLGDDCPVVLQRAVGSPDVLAVLGPEGDSAGHVVHLYVNNPVRSRRIERTKVEREHVSVTTDGCIPQHPVVLRTRIYVCTSFLPESGALTLGDAKPAPVRALGGFLL